MQVMLIVAFPVGVQNTTEAEGYSAVHAVLVEKGEV